MCSTTSPHGMPWYEKWFTSEKRIKLHWRCSPATPGSSLTPRYLRDQSFSKLAIMLTARALSLSSWSCSWPDEQSSIVTWNLLSIHVAQLSLPKSSQESHQSWLPLPLLVSVYIPMVPRSLQASKMVVLELVLASNYRPCFVNISFTPVHLALHTLVRRFQIRVRTRRCTMLRNRPSYLITIWSWR